MHSDHADFRRGLFLLLLTALRLLAGCFFIAFAASGKCQRSSCCDCCDTHHFRSIKSHNFPISMINKGLTN
ncbi:Uncharacterised protein [Mycobacteroides abscessus subsp. massiliense]|nr:Uncharacterised protein [Mycobacteroides abscessus subsp. massiliense]